MKISKKIITAAVAIALVFALCIPAFAIDLGGIVNEAAFNAALTESESIVADYINQIADALIEFFYGYYKQLDAETQSQALALMYSVLDSIFPA